MSASLAYIDGLAGPFGNPYVQMRRQRTREMYVQVLPKSFAFLPIALLDDAMDRFWRSEAPQQRYYRECAWHAAQILRRQMPSGWLRDLVDLECMRWRAGYLAAAPSQPAVAFDWPMMLKVCGTLGVLASDYAIHEAFADKPERRKTFLCVHRRFDNAIETRWMGPLEFDFLQSVVRDDATEPKSALEHLRRGVEHCEEKERETYVYAVSDFVAAMLASGAMTVRPMAVSNGPG